MERDIENLVIPQHVALILDGNGRWAKKRGLPRTVGHKQGCVTVEQTVEDAARLGIRYLTVYGFSTENWKRPKEEVDYLMSLLLDYLRNAEKTLSGENVVIRVIGSRKGLSEEICRQIIKTENFTKNNTGIVMNIALNYGGREEIVNAVKNICKDVKDGKQNIEDIDDEVFSSYLYTANQPDVDLLIRTSGEQRLSNYLPWQLAYTEFYFTPVPWPDFTKEELIKAVEAYNHRDRRYGGLKEE